MTTSTVPTPSADPAGQPTPPTPPTPTPPAAKTTEPTPPAGDPPKEPTTDEPLGEGGKKALEAEREARKELEKQLKALAPLQKLAEALGASDPAKGPTEIEQITERLKTHETELANERAARWRAEVANTKKLTAEQAAELRGATREELEAHADRLLTLFPTTPGAPGTPKPDPSQGARGAADFDTQIAAAREKGNVRESIRLKNLKAAAARQ